MILSVVALFWFLVPAVLGNVGERKKYTTKYDNIDIHEIIKNERLLKNYVDCLLEKGPCTPDGLELRSKFSCKVFKRIGNN